MSYRYIVDHIPKSTPYKRREGLSMTPEYITIHNTSNPTSSSRNERNWLTNPTNDRQASYHIVIDEKEAIEVIPLDEVSWNAGDGRSGTGNRKSIAIEICESGDYAKTLDNAVNLVADMLSVCGWGVDKLRRHYDWSGKNCPRLMNTDGKWTGWEEFKKRVEEKLNNNQNKLSVEDANKIIRFLSAGWFIVQGNKESEKEFNRLANELRKASGQGLE